jgi:hypothetical protein
MKDEVHAMSEPVFTPEQEARIKELIRELLYAPDQSGSVQIAGAIRLDGKDIAAMIWPDIRHLLDDDLSTDIGGVGALP